MPRFRRICGSAGVGAVHVVALLVGDHLERQLVVVAQERRPLAALGQLRGLLEDVDDRHPVLLPHRHEQPWHQREVEVHVALVAVAEVGGRGPRATGWPRRAASGRRSAIDVAAQAADELVGLGQVLARGAVPLEQVGHGVEAHAVDPEIHPVVDHLQHLVGDLGVVEVEVGLVAVEAVPEVGAGHRVPRPVRRLEVLEDDAGGAVAVGRVAPHVEVAATGSPPAHRRARWNHGCWSEVWFSTSSVITRMPRSWARRPPGGRCAGRRRRGIDRRKSAMS